jgi:hypothetical protein
MCVLLGCLEQTEAPNNRSGSDKILTIIIYRQQECLEKNCSLELPSLLPKEILCYFYTAGGRHQNVDILMYVKVWQHSYRWVALVDRISSASVKTGVFGAEPSQLWPVRGAAEDCWPHFLHCSAWKHHVPATSFLPTAWHRVLYTVMCTDNHFVYQMKILNWYTDRIMHFL